MLLSMFTREGSVSAANISPWSPNCKDRSTNATFKLWFCFNAHARLAAIIDLPTPALPEVTEITLPDPEDFGKVFRLPLELFGDVGPDGRIIFNLVDMTSV